MTQRDIGDESAPPPGGKRERNKADKRRRILAAARELFETRGFEATTTAEISRLAGVGAGTLYLYVESKDQLLFDVFTEDIDAAWAAGLDAIDPAAPVTERVYQLFAAVTRFHESRPTIAKTYHLEMMSVIARSDDGISATMDRTFATIESLLVQAQQAGELMAELETAVAARNLFAIWSFHMGYHYSHPGREIDETLVTVRSSIAVALLGVV